jgi:hypothetical protein
LRGRRTSGVHEVGGEGDELPVPYPNVPLAIGVCISAAPPLATLHELQTIYGVEDLFDLLEVTSINAHNQKIAMDRAKDK